MAAGPIIQLQAQVRTDVPADPADPAEVVLVKGPIAITGTVTVSVTGTVNVSVTGVVQTTLEPSTTSTLTVIPASAVPVLLLAANAARLGFSIRNTSIVDTLFILAGPGVVSAALHTVAIRPGAYYEDPYHFVGAITGVWTAATGLAMIDEYTP